jgi:thioredoxin reductase (NADPH)
VTAKTFQQRKLETGYDNIYQAVVGSNIMLNPAGSKVFRELTIKMPGIGEKIMPGDVIGIFPENNPDEVAEIISASGLNPSSRVTVRETKPGWTSNIQWQETMTLSEALTRWIHIQEPSRNLLEAIAAKTLLPTHPLRFKQEMLRELLKPENEAKLSSYLRTNTLLDVINEFPEILRSQEICDLSHNLDQRRYTVASIQQNEISIVESPIEYELERVNLAGMVAETTQRQGVFTSQLERLNAGATLRFYIDPCDFGLPDKPRSQRFDIDSENNSNAPQIFIAPGSGIAGALAILEELERKNHQGKCILITGNRCKETDFLYEEKIQHYKNIGLLEEVYFAESRPQNGNSNGNPKKYVQHVIAEQSANLWPRIADGGYIYLCGDRAMGEDVEQSLINLAIECGNLTNTQALEWLEHMKQSGHFQSHTYRQSMEFEKARASVNRANHHDVIVLGSGPAGCTAAIYSAQAGEKTLMLSGPEPGGQLTRANQIINFPGNEDPLDAPVLMERMRNQAINSGVVEGSDVVVSADFSRRPYQLVGASGNHYSADAVIITTGASPRKLGVKGEQEFTGRGVSTCATCDGYFVKGKPVMVVGGGDSAFEEALYLNKLGCTVQIIHRGDKAGLKASPGLQQKVMNAQPPITIHYNTEVTEIHGKETVTGASIRNNKTGEEKGIPVKGVFVAIGNTPNSDIFKNQLELDTNGYIKISSGNRTSAVGIYAAGEVADPSYRQAITSAGQGAAAAIDMLRDRGLIEPQAFKQNNHPEKNKGSEFHRDYNVVELLAAAALGAAGIAALIGLKGRSTNKDKAA